MSFANVVEVATGPGVVGVRGSEDSQYFVLSSGIVGLCVLRQSHCIIIHLSQNKLTKLNLTYSL